MLNCNNLPHERSRFFYILISTSSDYNIHRFSASRDSASPIGREIYVHPGVRTHVFRRTDGRTDARTHARGRPAGTGRLSSMENFVMARACACSRDRDASPTTVALAVTPRDRVPADDSRRSPSVNYSVPRSARQIDGGDEDDEVESDRRAGPRRDPVESRESARWKNQDGQACRDRKERGRRGAVGRHYAAIAL